MATQRGGRPSGLTLHAEGFAAILRARNAYKRDVAIEAEMSPGFLTDLTNHRAGASEAVSQRLADAVGVKREALFPELVGWIAPPRKREVKS